MSVPCENAVLLADGNETAAKAAAYAVRMAKSRNFKLAAVSVVDTDTLGRLLSVRILVEQEVKDFEIELEKSQRRYLDYVARLARKENLEIETVLRRGVCHAEVLAEIRERQADLLIIGGFHSTLTRLDLVARERQILLDDAPCPVLVVR